MLSAVSALPLGELVRYWWAFVTKGPPLATLEGVNEMHGEILGFAKIVKRRGNTFPFRNASYFDVTEWGGGFIRVSGAPGAVVIRGAVLLDLQTGRVYSDPRLAETTGETKGAALDWA